ncbi:MAG: TlyA family RNA methyltransferase [Clostridia bacterium]|nr:TlyA family RNA methyltransferase [Clostridia bacterium]
MRIDTYLFENAFFESREKAKKAISDGRITLNGKTVTKPSVDVSDNDQITVAPSDRTEYVGRGGIKLEHALDTFKIDVNGKRAIDIGASTGGFTDCLLKRGVQRVYAVDIGHDQLHPSLVNDERVVNLEGVNAREMTSELVDNSLVDIAVSDLSFISQKLVIPVASNVLAVDGIYIILIKPQFEAGREHLNKNGIVKSEKVRLKVVSDILEFSKSCGYEVIGSTASPIEGGSGNTEYLAVLKRIK